MTPEQKSWFQDDLPFGCSNEAINMGRIEARRHIHIAIQEIPSRLDPYTRADVEIAKFARIIDAQCTDGPNKDRALEELHLARLATRQAFEEARTNKQLFEDNPFNGRRELLWVARLKIDTAYWFASMQFSIPAPKEPAGVRACDLYENISIPSLVIK